MVRGAMKEGFLNKPDGFVFLFLNCVIDSLGARSSEKLDFLRNHQSPIRSLLPLSWESGWLFGFSHCPLLRLKKKVAMQVIWLCLFVFYLIHLSIRSFRKWERRQTTTIALCWEPLSRKHKISTSLKGRRKQNWKGWEGSFPRHLKGCEQWWQVRGEVQKCFFHVCRGSSTLLAGTASHCIVRDDGCAEDTSMEVWSRSVFPGSGSGSDGQEGLSCWPLFVFVHTCLHSV